MSAHDLASVFNANRQSPPNNEPQPPLKQSAPVDTSSLGDEQSLVFEAMENVNDSAFITGRAGTGKSYLLRFFVANSKKKVVVVAPTGVAALNVGGQTIHSFFCIPPKTPINKSELTLSSARLELYRNIDTIVVDEVSMVSSEIMDTIDFLLRKANGSSSSFGGKQILMFGDLYQLPPVVGPQVQRYLDDTFGGTFFFHAPAIRNSNIARYELTHIFRQKDKAFIEILNEVREGSISVANLAKLNERATAVPSNQMAIVIAPTKAAVERINTDMLNGLDEPLFTYEATIQGDIRETDFPTQRVLRLKIGARVMMLLNDQGTSSDRPNEKWRWVNGTLAQVSKLTKDQIWVIVNGVEHQINQGCWEKVQYSYNAQEKKLDKRKTAVFRQFPITLAWAITIHKAQGATYQSVGIDLAGGMFAEGQTYVALSRCVDMNKLYLTRPIEHQDIKVSNEVKAFMNNTASYKGELPREFEETDDVPF